MVQTALPIPLSARVEDAVRFRVQAGAAVSVRPSPVGMGLWIAPELTVIQQPLGTMRDVMMAIRWIMMGAMQVVRLNGAAMGSCRAMKSVIRAPPADGHTRLQGDSMPVIPVRPSPRHLAVLLLIHVEGASPWARVVASPPVQCPNREIAASNRGSSVMMAWVEGGEPTPAMMACLSTVVMEQRITAGRSVIRR